ncbi:amino acid ABC transporter substrate-binding protein, PAAT family [Limimonas halophila]|uniref:Amino acid ABC transporter substrate-binding protein, PAAT family n=1 Tax=Limimonas halophila TaxID=1082479 RepID=A0A1G7QGW1_9PROT|nr:transporter substrate-binding domain-containing protein [Limimonas halophila]SDF97787.1 amino acid ABC transporter substrate-binding protein, PAAT family [Limimonas halophila]
MRRIALALVAVLVAPMAQAGPIDKLSFYTEQYPPYNMKIDGEKTGISIDLTRAIFEEADTGKTIADVTMAPWSRGYNKTLNQANTVVFATTRTENREDKFTWVGPIASTKIGVIGPADKPAIDDLAQLHDARTATIRDDVAEQLLMQKGVPKSALHRVSNLDSILKLLAAGRATYWAYEVNVSKYALKNEGMADRFDVKHVLKSGELYYAFNPDTDPAAIEAFRKAFEAVKDSGKLDEILAKYLG